MIVGRPDANRLPQHHEKPERLHLGCGEDHRPEWLNVDANPDVEPDVVADLEEEWEFAPDNSVEVIEARQVVEHLEDRAGFFAEAARVLRPGGVLRISVPLGVNADTDSDHEAPNWTYRTPEQFSRPHRRSWDPDIPLELINRSVDVWLGGPLSAASPLLRLAAHKWPAWAAYRCYAGILTAEYRRMEVNDE
ncbi:class I SAM-dependent methyltransferase [Halopelagius longus]|uniref:Methyltransferase domain-containing protein n=1 Tax=Halopelagius longus TaxID=1236180 RepID=A0A1H1FQS6_9EURY|nr:methyltransferase domain-containing protein [Halopelagius longus]RDI70206.1 methyltransferase domain-containing protein [Halopelagius longus]SDR03342.1 Methyltransferase domain-containing protein [Halopelagius longus]